MALTLDSKIPAGPLADKWTNHKFDLKLVNPANRRKFEVIVVGTGLAGAAAAAIARRARLQRQGLHVPRLAPSGALDRGPGRHQRGEELQERRRQRAPPLLRHDQGRRLPRPRRQRAPPRRGVGQHHRPVHRAGRALRPRVRRPARQPLLRWRAGRPHVLRPGPDRPAAAARRLPGPRPPDPPGHGHALQPHGHARRRRPTRACASASSPATCSPARSARTPPTPCCSRPAATATSTSCRPTPRRATSPRPGGRTRRARRSPTPATRRSTRPASRPADEFQSKLTLMSESLRNDGRIWVPKAIDDKRSAERDPRGRARLLPRAQVPGVRQPGAPRRRLAQRQDRRRRGSRRRPAPERRVPRLRRRHRPLRRRHDQGATGTCSTCTSASPARTRTPRRCASTPPPTTRWAGCGWTTTCRPPSRASSPWARRTSPTTAPTAWAPRRSCRAWPTATSSPPTTVAGYLAGPARHLAPGDDPRGVHHGARARPRTASTSCWRSRARSRSTTTTASSARSSGTTAAWPATRPASRRRCGDPRDPRGVLDGRQGARRRRELQPVAREGAARRRLHGDGRAQGARRAAPRGVLRRPLPRGAPDRRGRGEARRRELRLRRGLGVRQARTSRRTRCSTRSRSCSRTSS